MYNPLQKRKRTGKEYGCFSFVWKTKIHSNERSTKFERLYQEYKYLEEVGRLATKS